MSRETYRNGDPIGLQENGCDGCSPSMIQGFLCHESGCPDAWRDRKAKCNFCGCTFPLENRNDTLCQGCLDDHFDSEFDREDNDETE